MQEGQTLQALTYGINDQVLWHTIRNLAKKAKNRALHQIHAHPDFVLPPRDFLERDEVLITETHNLELA